MAIRMGSDLGAPLTVTAIDLVGETIWPKYSSWITYGMTAVGYVAGFMNKGGDFVKNIGVASFPLSAKRIYDTLSTPTVPVTSRASSVAFRGRVSRYPAGAGEAPFTGVKLV